MSLQAKFRPNTEADTEHTITWLNASGLAAVTTLDELHELGDFELQLRDTPPVLSYLSQLGDLLSISRITPQGLAFYLTDIPLWLNVPEKERRTTSDWADGFLFCPMSNVICFNLFGNIYAARPEK
ncbi:hypothetical protein [Ralstonia sp. 24A2]|uniref:hypothetical protein n=1 Tax=Ralstonia sp. 24A2 TaxID=3447364 RepID=UPI003F695056